jgi:hypothetical protein
MPSYIVLIIAADAFLAYWLFIAIDQVTYGDRSSIREILFKNHGWIGRVIGGVLLVLAPLTLIVVLLWVIGIIVTVLVVVWLPNSDQDDEHS